MTAVNWPVMGNIAASWVVSPVLGASLAAVFLYVVKRTITYQSDVLAAAARMVPILGAAMGWSFASNMMLKGLPKVVDVTAAQAILGGGIVAIAVWALVRVTHPVAEQLHVLGQSSVGRAADLCCRPVELCAWVQ